MSAILDTGLERPAARWAPSLLALAVVVAALCGLYAHTLVTMIGIWRNSETFTHCFLVLPISLWLVWRQRATLSALSPQPQPWFVAALLPLALLWLVADMAAVNAATQFAFVGLLVLAVPAVLGWAVAREIAFPLGFLFFMVPFGDFMLPQFMDWTADFTVFAIAASGVPVYREGLNFVIPSGSWSVVEACSGVRYMLASLMVGTLFAYLNYNSLRRRLLFCGVALIVPLVANWVRAYGIVMLGHLSNNKLAVGVDHLVYGWVFFGVIIMLMFMIGARWTEPLLEPEPRAPGAHASGPTPAAVMATTVALLAVLGLPHLANDRLGAAAPGPLTTPFSLPELADTTASTTRIDFEPVFKNAASTAVRSYPFEGGLVQVHVAFYRGQSYGRKLISSENYLVSSEDAQWRRGASASLPQPLQAHTLTWRATELLEGSMSASTITRRRLDVRQTYWVGGRFLARDSFTALAIVLSRLAGQGDDAAAITLVTEGLDGVQTRQRLDRFAERHLAAIEAQVSAYSAQR